MGDEYQALARAIRRPMRRWWLRVGSWWIGAAVVLLAALACTICYEYWLYGVSGLPMPGSDWKNSILRLHYLAIPMLTTAWLLAALRVNRLITELICSIPGFAALPLLAMRFWLACRAGILPLVLLLLYGYLFGLQKEPELLMGSVAHTTFLSPIGELRITAAILANMLWILCFTCFGKSGAFGAVLWHLGCNVILQTIAYLDSGLRISYFRQWITDPAGPRLSLPGENLLIVAVLAVAYLILVLYIKGPRRLGQALATILGCAQILAGIGLWTGVWLFDIVLRGAMHVQHGSLLVLNTVHRTYNEQMWLCALAYRWPIPWPEEFAFVALYVPLAVLAAHYLAISWILRNVRPGRA